MILLMKHLQIVTNKKRKAGGSTSLEGIKEVGFNAINMG